MTATRPDATHVVSTGTDSIIRVPAGPMEPQEYEIVVRAGAFAELPRYAASVQAGRYAVIADDNVAALFGAAACDALRAAGLAADLLTFPAGEPHKTRATWSALCDRMLELQCGRDTCVIALGGGVTGDLAGFVAATYMRGVPLIQVPTSLLAMIDASVGGKTGVDTTAGKNLIGAFHAPRVVIADPALLHSLPGRELRSGLAEAVKHGAILDAAYLDWIVERAEDLLAAHAAAVERLVRRSVELKAAIVAADPFERGVRAVLNFGHTVAHALEQGADYTMPHGYAVGIGMLVEAAAGERLGITAPGTCARLREALRRCDLPVRPERTTIEELQPAMLLDKKARQAKPRFVLLSSIGTVAQSGPGAWTHDVDAPALSGAWRAVIEDAELV